MKPSARIQEIYEAQKKDGGDTGASGFIWSIGRYLDEEHATRRKCELCLKCSACRCDLENKS